MSEVLPTEEILIKLLLLFERKNLLGTPETSLRGLSTLNVLRVDKSSLAPPSSVFGSSIGRNLVTSAELAHEYILLLYKEVMDDLYHSPRHNYHEVHDVPRVPESKMIRTSLLLGVRCLISFHVHCSLGCPYLQQPRVCCFILTPTLPEIGVWVHDEAHGQDFGAHLHCVDTGEDGLQFLLHMMVRIVMMQ